MIEAYLEYKLYQVLLLKCLYDLGRLKNLWSEMGKHYKTEMFSEDFDMDLAIFAECALFKDFNSDFNEDYETQLMTIRDDNIDRYFRLCQKYEHKKGITALQDSFFREADQYLYDALGNLSTQDHAYQVQYPQDEEGSCQILYEYGSGEWFGAETMVAFADYLLYLRDGAKKIEAAIEALDRADVVSLPGVAVLRQEAA